MRKLFIPSKRTAAIGLLAVGLLSISLSAQAFPLFKKKKKDTKRI